MNESALRRKANRRGYRIERSRESLHSSNRGLYQLIANEDLSERLPDGTVRHVVPNQVVLGVRFDASLENINEYLEEQRRSG